MGTTGGNTDDMLESLRLTESGKINPAVMVTHVGGLDSCAEATLNLPYLPGGKKLVYTQISMPMTAITDFRKLEQQTAFWKISGYCGGQPEFMGAPGGGVSSGKIWAG